MSTAQISAVRDLRPESPAFVVILSILQLSLVVMVWLLAIVPAALLALGALVFKTVKGALRPAARGVGGA
ncbi:MAG: hypothetical protein J7521_13615 [Caulobacter sp.]|nr:hypothetical protein [Caulobacter sp.]